MLNIINMKVNVLPRSTITNIITSSADSPLIDANTNAKQKNTKPAIPKTQITWSNLTVKFLSSVIITLLDDIKLHYTNRS